MQLCKPLYDQSLQPKEKEIMQMIFEREQRREKNLDVMKRLAEKKPAKPVKDPAVQQQKKQEALEKHIQELDQKFFDHVCDGENDIEAVKQRAAASVDQPPAEEKKEEKNHEEEPPKKEEEEKKQ